MSQANAIVVLLGEPVLSDLACYRLELLGYDVRRVASGDAAINQVELGDCGLLILDTSIPEGDGLVWLSNLRRRISADVVPVMIVSLDPSLDTVRRAFESGAQDYLITPFDPIVLEEKVNDYVNARIQLQDQTSLDEAKAIAADSSSDETQTVGSTT